MNSKVNFWIGGKKLGGGKGKGGCVIAVNLRYWQNGAGPKSIWVHRAGGQKGKK
jgi:hypothetical protein